MDQHPPNLPLDFVDLLAAFAGAGRYLVIGGYAVNLRPSAPPRISTSCSNPAPENISRACRALLEFGAADIAAISRGRRGRRGRMDGASAASGSILLKDAPGVNFAGAWERQVVDVWNGVPAIPDLARRLDPFQARVWTANKT
ncbi:MAG: hypothetical protein U0P30_00050 [Vicinamibacterales bacterium]